MIRKGLIFHGRVQGVGFRYTAILSARKNLCTGWVRNELNGTVSMEIQGEDANVGAVLDSLYNDSYIIISRIESTDLPLNHSEVTFQRR